MASDNCALDRVTYVDSSTGACPADIVITRTYTAYDACENVSVTCAQTITIQDTTVPVITQCPAAQTYEGCSTADIGGTDLPYTETETDIADFTAIGGIATDNCALDRVTYVDSSTGACPADIVITRTYTAYDACGNVSITCAQTITIQDTTIPVIDQCPTAQTYEGCSTADIGGTDLPYTETETDIVDFSVIGGIASDNCALDRVTYVDSSTGACPADIVITRTYTAYDDCGNVSATCAQTITIQDTSIPVIDQCPPNQTYESCSTDNLGNDLPFALTETVVPDFAAIGGSASDNCSLNRVTYFDTQSGSCPDDIVITRTYTAYDDCDNVSVTCVQTINLQDTSLPVIDQCPAAQTYEGCSTADIGGVDLVYTETETTVPDFTLIGGVASDDCALDRVTYVDSSAGACPDDIVITRTYTAYDACGNASISCTQTITIQDTTIPVIDQCPAAQTYEGCSPADIGGVDLPYSETEVTVPDFTAIGGLASDNCSLNRVTYFDTMIGACPDDIVITRTYTAYDDCDNVSVTCTQTITIQDTTIPVIDLCPAAQTYEGCSTADIGGADLVYTEIETVVPDFVAIGGIASDNCSLNRVTYFDAMTGSCPDDIVITRTYTAYDDCNNVSVTCAQTITIQDTTIPVIDQCPAAQTYEGCSTADIGGTDLAYTETETIVPDFTAIGGSASDNCSLNRVTYFDTMTGTCPDDIVITRTYTAYDDCDNVSVTCTQTITIQDTTIPVITQCPANQTYEGCSSADIGGTDLAYSETETIVPDFTLIGGIASDNCSLNRVTYFDTMTGACPDDIVVTRTYTAYDDCDNVSVTCVQTITIEDTTSPIIVCQDISVSLDDNGMAVADPALMNGGTTDNCSDAVSITYELDIYEFGCDNIGPNAVVLTATDLCGNSSTCEGTIFVIGEVPSFVGATDYTVCSDTELSIDVIGSYANASTYTWAAFNSNPNNSLPIDGSTGSISGPLNVSHTNVTGQAYDIFYVVNAVSDPTQGGCEAPPVTITVNVLPEGTITNMMEVDICSDEDISLFLMGQPIATFVLDDITTTDPTVVADPGNVVMNIDDMYSTGDLVNDSWTNQTSDIQTVVYTLTPVSGMDCFGDPFMLMVNVAPEPVGVDPGNLVECSDVPLDYALIDYVTNLDVVSFTWTATPNADVTGESTTSVTNNSLIDDLVNVSSDPQIVTYTVIPTSEMGCLGDPFTLDVTVNPEPVGIDTDFDICSDVGLSIDHQGLIGNLANGVTFEWIGNDNPNVIGETLTTSIDQINTDDLVNTTSNEEVVTYTVTPTSAEGCLGQPFTVNVNVAPEPVGENLEFSFCSGSTLDVELQTQILNLDNTTFSWAAEETNFVNGESFTTQTSLFIQDNLVNNSDSYQEVIYEVTPTVEGCSGQPFFVTVNVAPTLRTQPNSSGICIGDPSLVFSNISGGTPPYSIQWQDLGTGTATGYTIGSLNDLDLTVNAYTATTGSVNLAISVVDALGCTTSGSVSFFINPNPTITLDPEDVAVCPGGSATFTGDALESNVTFQWFVQELNGPLMAIPGATTTTLTIDDIDRDMNGFKYSLGALLDNDPDPDCWEYTEAACLYVHQPVQLICNDMVNVSLDDLCSPENLNAGIFLEDDELSDFYTYEIIAPTGDIVDLFNQSSEFHISNYVGECLTYKVNDICYDQNCWGTVCIEDAQPPTPDCECESPYLEVTQFEGTLDETDNVWTRPFVTGGTCNASAVGVDVPYDAFEFELDMDGANEFEVMTFTAPSADSFLALYEGCFDPTDPCANLVITNDDANGSFLSEITTTLEAGINYFLVMTTFDENGNDYGDYVITTNTTATISIKNPDCRFYCYDIWDLEILENPGRNNEVLPDYDDLIPDDNCIDFGAPEITYDLVDGPDCGQQTLTRSLVWYWTDKEGELQEILCQQNYLLDAINLNNVGSTDNGAWDGHPDIFEAQENDGQLDYYLPEPFVYVECGTTGVSPEEIATYFDIDTPGRPTGVDRDDYDETPNIVEYNEGIPYAYPYVVVQGWNDFHAKPIDNNICNLYAVYDDQEIESCGDACKGNGKVVRTWTMLDWCKASTVTYVQIIKIVDEEGPTVGHPDITVSVGPWDCEVDIDVPVPTHLHDNCDSDGLTWTLTGSGSSNVFPIENGVIQNVTKGTYSFIYTAEDCCGNLGSSTMNITVVDDTPPVVITKQDIVLTFTEDIDGDGTGEGSAKLFAKDVDNFSYDGCTDVHLEIRRAEDKKCKLPGNSTFNNDGHEFDVETDTDNGEFVKFCCADFHNRDDNGFLYGMHDVILRVWDDADMDGVFGSAGDNYNEAWATIRIEEKLQPIVICPPNMVLECDQQWDDYDLTGRPYAHTTCDEIDCDQEPNDSPRPKSASQPPIIFDEFGAPVAVPAYNPSCRRGAILRTWNCGGDRCEQWLVILDTDDEPVNIVWPADQEVDCLDTDAGQPDVTEKLCETIGTNVESDTFFFEDGACYKILNHWTVINWCDYDADDPDLNEIPEPGLDDGFVPGYYAHTQIIKLIDTEEPVLTVQDSCYAVDANCLSSDIQLKASATDNGLCGSPWLKWEVDIDVWGDWSVDYQYSSFLPADNPFFINPSTGSGSFVSPTASGEEICISLPDGIPGTCGIEHRAIWTVHDGCGNKTSGTSIFTLDDKKKPTPYMIDLSTAVMQNGSVELWAIDFNAGSFDNCTPQSQLKYTFSPIAPPQLLDPTEADPWYDIDGVASLSDYQEGIAERWNGATGTSGKVFDCDDLEAAAVNGGILQIPVYVWDDCGNYDFTNVNLKLVDNQSACGESPRAMIAGRIITESGEGVEDVLVSANSEQPNYPAQVSTDDEGEFAFEDNPMYNHYVLNSEKNDDYLNGVSTLDLIIIQKHILNIETLDNVYKMIAADANNDENISAIDIIEIRRLILGLTDVFPSNDSWRFVDAEHEMQVENPWPFDEAIVVSDLETDMMSNDFVGVKIGDVNNSVIANLHTMQSENRSSNALKFKIENIINDGETTELQFSSSNFSEVYGFQFTLETDGGLVSAKSGSLKIGPENMAYKNGAVTMSWHSNAKQTFSDDEILFSIQLLGDHSLKNLTLSDRITRSEAYVTDAYTHTGIELEGALTNDTFVLSQNEPNPWKGETRIGFYMPKEGSANFKVLDVSGKVLFSQNAEYAQGNNIIVLKDKDLSTTANILYYRIESGEFSETRKMILLKN